MSDTFGRHESKRWVRASIPTYGDDWDNEYDYDFDEKPEQDSMISVDDSGAKKADETQQKKDGNLVLTIDKFSNRNDDSEDSSDDEIPEVLDEGAGGAGKFDSTLDFRQNNDSTSDALETSQEHTGTNKPSSLDIAPVGKESDSLEPPTPNFNNVPDEYSARSPTSDQNTQSDNDSIQMEPEELNMKTNNDDRSSLTSRISEKNEKEEEEEVEREVTKKPDSDEKSQPLNPLVLSIDNRRFSKSDDSDEDSSNGIGTPNLSYIHEQHKDEKIESLDAKSESNEEKNGKTASAHEDILDSLISDLEKASFSKNEESTAHTETEGDKSTEEILPTMDSIHDLSLPDFEHASYDTSFSSSKIETNDNEVESAPHTPIEPLSISHKEEHEKYVKAMTERHPSVRKPPPMGRHDLVSMDYSNIADAMSGYIDSSTNSPLRQTRDSTPEIPQSNSDREKSVEPEQIDNDGAHEHVKAENTPRELETVTPDLNKEAATINENSDEVNSIVESERQTERKPTLLSMQSEYGSDNDDFVMPPKGFSRPPVDRRVSTASTGTFNLGGWNPNTANFRDQFISDNDNESNLNFNMNEDESYYDKFTKGPSSQNSDVASSSSTLSVPDTIDGGLPGIDEESDDEVNVSGDKSTEAESSLGTGTDSVLADHEYESTAFKEEKNSLREENGGSTRRFKHQRYSSLIPPMSDEEIAETRRKLSHRRSSSVTSPPSISAPSKRNFTPISAATGSSMASLTADDTFSRKSSSSAPPLYSWKEIMSTSQPVDRIAKLREALQKEKEYETGLNDWLRGTLRSVDLSSNIHIGKIASEAYQNASHSDIRRHASLRSRVSLVKDKVETSGLQASNFGKKFFNRGKKFMKSNGSE